MSFSNDNSNWTEWKKFSNLVNYTLPTGDGLKNIYFRVMDRAGNLADPVCAIIILNTTVPDYYNNEKPKNDPDFSGFSSLPIFWILLVIILFSLLIIFSYCIYLRRDLKKEPKVKDAIMAKRSKIPKVIETEIHTLEPKQKKSVESNSGRINAFNGKDKIINKR